MSLAYRLTVAVFLFASSDLLALGESSELPRPTMVKLASDELILADHVARLDKQGPNRIEVAPDPQHPRDEILITRAKRKEMDVSRTYRFREPEPISFWSAVDRICMATRRRPVLQRAPQSRVVLVPASSDRGFVCHENAIRFAIVSLTYWKGGLVTPSTRPKRGETGPGQRHSPAPNAFEAKLLITPEPRLKILKVVGSTIHSAVDEHDRSLLIPDAGRSVPADSPTDLAYFDEGVYLSIRLLYHEQPGEVIRRLKGSVTLKCVATDGGRPAQGTANFDFSDVPMP